MRKRIYLLISILIIIPVVVVLFSETNRQTNPPINPLHTLESNISTPPEIDALLHRSCYNCHSDETHWPLLSRLPVVSSQIARDVQRARGVMNFSEWSVQAGRRPDLAASTLLAACTVLQTHQMPKRRYLLMHPDAWVTDKDANQFCQWAKSEAKVLVATNSAAPSR
ncbi:MAG TPA: heme-binding domain-containing protein [Bryobacteraceae bacterium]|nr:heme-binding domain-containing protein [Bryobacteraceae bacterium]